LARAQNDPSGAAKAMSYLARPEMPSEDLFAGQDSADQVWRNNNTRPGRRAAAYSVWAWSDPLSRLDCGRTVRCSTPSPRQPPVRQNVLQWHMARAISVRLDDEADRALRVLESTGLTQSEAIRVSLLGELRHRRQSKELAAEVAALEADGQDHDEMLAVAELMEALRAPR